MLSSFTTSFKKFFQQNTLAAPQRGDGSARSAGSTKASWSSANERIRNEILDGLDEELEMELDDLRLSSLIDETMGADDGQVSEA